MALSDTQSHGRIGALRAPLTLTLLSLLGFGLVYSLVGTGLGYVLFPAQARGSLLERDGRVIGSRLVAQPFVDARYFQPRPSAAGYDPMAAAGSNQARGNPDLRTRLGEARARVAEREGVPASAIPVELITQSGSGLDPEITPAGARLQAARVAAARGLDRGEVEALIAGHAQGPQLGVLGQARVNVLELNLALDALASTSRPR